MGKINSGRYTSKKEVITNTAASLFILKGFKGSSMRDLAESIGVEAPSLYNHITSKSAILQEICFKVANLFTMNLDKVDTEDSSLLQKMEKILRFHIRMMVEEFEIVHISDHEWKHLSEPYLSNFKNQRKNYRARLARIVQEGINTKEIIALNPYVTVLTMLSAVGGIEVWHRSPKTVNATTIEENMVSIFIRGIQQK